MRQLEKLQFSGKDEDFPWFMKQFEARMCTLGLYELDHETEGAEASTKAERPEKQREMWCELVQCLDKKSVAFIRPHKPNGAPAWEALIKQFKSSERPRVQNLMMKLTSLKMDSSEQVVDYIPMAEDLKLDLVEAGQEIADALFRSLVLKGLTSHFDSLVAVISYETEKDSD